MVKAPRSKGCRVCVTRRIKCDQGRPFCMRCQKANRQCPGYETTKFVDEGPSLRAQYDIEGDHRGSSARPASDEDDSSGPNRRPSAYWSQNTGIGSRSWSPPEGFGVLSTINSGTWPSGSFERAALVSFLCPTTYQDQLMSSFIESIRSPATIPTFVCHSVWLSELITRPTSSKALVWSIRALSISHLGRRSGDRHVIETSRRAYGKAIVELRDAVLDAEEGYSSDTLSATLLLSFYEIFNCTDHFGWIRHAGGAGRLIKQRGPDRHRSGFDLLVFVACRWMVVMESFAKRIPCFLDQPEWRELCHEVHTNQNLSSPLITSNEEYFQVMVRLPSFIDQTWNAIAGESTPQDRLDHLIRLGQGHRSDLQKNHAWMESELSATSHQPKQVPSAHNDSTVPVVWDFPDVHIASLYCGYWCTLIVLNITIIGLQAKAARLYRSFADPNCGGDVARVAILPGGRGAQIIPDRTAKRPLWDAARTVGDHHFYFQENRRCAREICKAVEWIKPTPFLGPMFLIIALRMALRMELSDRERDWMIEQLTDMGQSIELARTELEVYTSEKGKGDGSWQDENWKETKALFSGDETRRGPRGSDNNNSPPVPFGLLSRADATTAIAGAVERQLDTSAEGAKTMAPVTSSMILESTPTSVGGGGGGAGDPYRTNDLVFP